jgi:hypothetical protein
MSTLPGAVGVWLWVTTSGHGSYFCRGHNLSRVVLTGRSSGSEDGSIGWEGNKIESLCL